MKLTPTPQDCVLTQPSDPNLAVDHTIKTWGLTILPLPIGRGSLGRGGGALFSVIPSISREPGVQGKEGGGGNILLNMKGGGHSVLSAPTASHFIICT